MAVKGLRQTANRSFVCFFVVILVFVCFVASDVLTTICHLAIAVNVCMIIIVSIGNTK